jgi:hypothetical protein
MMGVGGLASAHNTGLGRDKLEVELVAQSTRFGRDSIMLKIRELCCGQCRDFCSQLGLRRHLRHKGVALSLSRRSQFGEFLAKRVFDEQRIRGVEGVLGWQATDGSVVDLAHGGEVFNFEE